MEKKYVCSADQRSFRSKAALDQHRRDSHGASGSKKGRKPPPARSSPRRLPSQAGPANLVAQAQMVSGRARQDYAVMNGLDRLGQIDDVSKYGPGVPLFNIVVVPSSFPRLARAGAVFQKIVYEKLVFRIEPQISASTSGGYVAGFVNDPDDRIVNLNQLTSLPNSVTTKWWQGAAVDARPTRREYFTAHGVELREFSPGTFVLMVDGKATQPGNLAVFCEWEVRLSGAVMESPPAKVTSVAKDWFIRNGHQGLWVKTGKSSPNEWSDTPADLIGSDAKVGDSYRLPYPVALVKPNDNVLALHHYVYVQDATGVFLAVNGPTDYYAASYTTDNLVVTKGTVLEKITVEKLQGEAQGPSSPGSEAMTSGPETSDRTFEQFVRALKAYLKSSDALEKRPEESRALSPFEELH